MSHKTLNIIGITICLFVLTIGNEPGWQPVMWLVLSFVNLYGLLRRSG